MKITIKNIIKENKDIDPKQRYINGILNIITPPYFNFLRVNEVPKDMWEEILSKVFNTKVTYRNIEGEIFTYDSNNNEIYQENSSGYWEKREFDSNNNNIYREESNGYWMKREYDSNNNQIYYEDSDGFWEKREFDSNNNVIYYENSNGYWEKREYDSNNNKIYQVYSNGYWEKNEYDENNNIIYFEDSDGEIIDNRSSNSLNENTDPKQRYINGISNMIRRPYMGFLINNEVPEELWKGILSNIFNTDDISWEKRIRDNKVYYELIIQNEKGKQLYYETHDYWEQLIYGYHTFLDMDFTWYINSVGSKKVTFVGKHNPVVYSNGPTGHPWSGLSDDIKNNKFFDLNY